MLFHFIHFLLSNLSFYLQRMQKTIAAIIMHWQASLFSVILLPSLASLCFTSTLPQCVYELITYTIYTKINLSLSLLVEWLRHQQVLHLHKSNTLLGHQHFVGVAGCAGTFATFGFVAELIGYLVHRLLDLVRCGQ